MYWTIDDWNFIGKWLLREVTVRMHVKLIEFDTIQTGKLLFCDKFTLFYMWTSEQADACRL